jgi:hypothetical protein
MASCCSRKQKGWGMVLIKLSGLSKALLFQKQFVSIDSKSLAGCHGRLSELKSASIVRPGRNLMTEASDLKMQ